MQLYGFGFSIPADATITGITVELERNCDAGETGQDVCIRLLDASRALTGDNKAVAGNWPTTPTPATYGGSTDTWNASPTPTMVNDSDFGVGISVQATSGNAEVYIDYVTVSITYTFDFFLLFE